MSEIDLSIIIPVYNTESKILKRCIESILKIKNIRYEILLIDNGSEEIYSNEYKDLVKNILHTRYLLEEKSGVSFARNLGITEANGKYIMFVDSDDEIYANAILPMHFLLNADIVFYNMEIVKGNKIQNIRKIVKQEGKIDSRVILMNDIIGGDFNESCGKLYYRDFLIQNNIFFNTDFIQGEDANFNLDVLKQCPYLYHIDKTLYIYYQNSITDKNRYYKYFDIIIENIWDIFLKKLKIVEEMNFTNENPEITKVVIKNYIDTVFRRCMLSSKNKNIVQTYSKQLEKINISEGKFNKITKIKYFIVKNEHGTIIKIANKLRNLVKSGGKIK